MKTMIRALPGYQKSHKRFREVLYESVSAKIAASMDELHQRHVDRLLNDPLRVGDGVLARRIAAKEKG